MMTRRRWWMASLAPVLLAQAPSGEEHIWGEFLKWLRAQPPAGLGAQVLKQYRATLAASGLPEAQVNEQMGVISRLAPQRRQQLMATHFNRIYASSQPIFNKQPNAFLAAAVKDMKPGRALDVAMGEGRNAVFLAQQGWEVTGFDISDEGLAAAQVHARKAGVKIATVLESCENFDYGKEQWDLVVMIYAFVPMSDAGFLRRLEESLKPGGVVLVEQFNANPESPGAKGPPNALLKSFERFRILHYEDKTAVGDWEPRPARLGRLLAEKL